MSRLCGRATVTNTDRIDFRSTGRARLDLQAIHRPFAPGATAERGRDEIEVVLHGVTGLWVKIGDGADVVRVGRGGVNVDGGDDADVLVGRLGQDILDGGPGPDVVWGLGGADLLFGGTGAAEPQPAGDELHGGSGNDVLHGSTMPDSMYGDGGDDVFWAADEYTEVVVDGGLGDDAGQLDSVDPRTSIERLLAN